MPCKVLGPVITHENTFFQRNSRDLFTKSILALLRQLRTNMHCTAVKFVVCERCFRWRFFSPSLTLWFTLFLYSTLSLCLAGRTIWFPHTLFGNLSPLAKMFSFLVSRGSNTCDNAHMTLGYLLACNTYTMCAVCKWMFCSNGNNSNSSRQQHC